ncbi:hypothetical protein D3C84_495840 [compost metagenome]
MQAQHSIVAQAGCSPQFCQHRVCRYVDQLICKDDASRWLITCAIDREDEIVRDDRCHHHFVAGQCASLVSADDGYRT